MSNTEDTTSFNLKSIESEVQVIKNARQSFHVKLANTPAEWIKNFVHALDQYYAQEGIIYPKREMIEYRKHVTLRFGGQMRRKFNISIIDLLSEAESLKYISILTPKPNGPRVVVSASALGVWEEQVENYINLQKETFQNEASLVGGMDTTTALCHYISPGRKENNLIGIIE